jgi:hypothetical protein
MGLLGFYRLFLFSTLFWLFQLELCITQYITVYQDCPRVGVATLNDNIESWEVSHFEAKDHTFQTRGVRF